MQSDHHQRVSSASKPGFLEQGEHDSENCLTVDGTRKEEEEEEDGEERSEGRT